MEYAQLKPGRAFKPLQSLLYYLQRIVTSRCLRHMITQGLTEYIRRRHGAMSTDTESYDQVQLDSLRQHGHAALGELLSAEQLSHIRDHLSSKSLLAQGAKAQAFTIEQVPPGLRLAEYELRDILDCPHLLELANHPAILRLAGDYIGCKPTLSALGLRWSFPDAGAGSGSQAFHRDCDDWRFMKVMVYLTDVDAETGPHIYVQGTHLERCSMRLQVYSDNKILNRYGEKNIVNMMGVAGTGFAVNTQGIHKGMLPSQKPRLLLQIQYSLLPVYIYRYRPATGLQKPLLDRYINRLFVSNARK
ncbi:phytanoyl-CoA dioxygenase family protein [Glaciimonas sp. CA11.2]|nr:phytanoyl-CoA dioxygenase family protein [Glaciimonas sp. CA11.2]MEB0165171.1 phytanoyl-CoA dioxygenase family protein [Glaciimonas sp. CA11.2]